MEGSVGDELDWIGLDSMLGGEYDNMQMSTTYISLSLPFFPIPIPSSPYPIIYFYQHPIPQHPLSPQPHSIDK